MERGRRFSRGIDIAKLTATEAAVQGMQMQEHRQMKCLRCDARIDLSGGDYVCLRGEAVDVVQALPGSCRSFVLAEQKHWRD